MRAAMKPISTVPRALDTVDVATGEPAKAINQRSDVCAVPAAGVVAEAMVALVLADAVLEKFGGDSVAESARNRRPTSTRSRKRCARGDDRRVVLVGPPGLGQDDGRPRARPRGSASRPATPTPTSRPRPDARSPRSSSRRASRASASWSTPRSRPRWTTHDGVLALGGGAVLDPRTEAALAGHTVVFLDVGIADAAAAGRLQPATGRC